MHEEGGFSNPPGGIKQSPALNSYIDGLGTLGFPVGLGLYIAELR